MVGHPPHGKVPKSVSDLGGKTAEGTAPRKENGRMVEIHLGGGSKGGDGILVHGGVY